MHLRSLRILISLLAVIVVASSASYVIAETASLTLTGPPSFDMAMKMNGANVASGQFTLSADGTSMTVDSLFGAGPAQERSKAIREAVAAIAAHPPEQTFCLDRKQM